MTALIAVRFAEPADRDALIAFIRDYWSSNHVFVHAPEVFDWQYWQNADRLNMVFAHSDNTILGVLGFIPMGRFDSALGDTDIMLALWKVRDDLAPPGLGIRLLKFIQTQLKPRMIGAIGISEMVVPIYRALGFTLDRLHHAALFNPFLSGKMLIASGVPDFALSNGSKLSAGDWHLEQIREIDSPQISAKIDKIARTNLPIKSLTYLQTRYLDHPYYQYGLGLLWRQNELESIVVWRRVECNGAHILRIVDIVGETGWLAHGQALLLPLVQECEAEYIDLMQAGTADEVLQAGGWISPDWAPGLILPNYFAPFEMRNVTIKLCYRLFAGNDNPIRLYRADSDQDRPNQPPTLGPIG